MFFSYIVPAVFLSGLQSQPAEGVEPQAAAVTHPHHLISCKITAPRQFKGAFSFMPKATISVVQINHRSGMLWEGYLPLPVSVSLHCFKNTLRQSG